MSYYIMHTKSTSKQQESKCNEKEGHERDRNQISFMQKAYTCGKNHQVPRKRIPRTSFKKPLHEPRISLCREREK